MKIISWNVNGLRAVCKKGFLDWLKKTNADIVCLQEIKADENQIPEELLKTGSYYVYINSANTRKGYSGVLVFTKEKPSKINGKIGYRRFDSEGRMLELHFKDFVLINLYLPHGGRGKEKLGYKLEAYDNLFRHLKKLKNKKMILIGDFNIAHKEIDLARPKQNQDNIMFTPEERKKIDEIIKLGFIDTFRALHPKEQKFTWWPYAFDARERNLGWRIDYAFTSKNIFSKIESSNILTEVKDSDHCPIMIKLAHHG